ncbi:hypothetical protein BT69DRAFT_77360, partial [Atractiella rhizophila]
MSHAHVTNLSSAYKNRIRQFARPAFATNHSILAITCPSLCPAMAHIIRPSSAASFHPKATKSHPNAGIIHLPHGSTLSHHPAPNNKSPKRSRQSNFRVDRKREKKSNQGHPSLDEPLHTPISIKFPSSEIPNGSNSKVSPATLVKSSTDSALLPSTFGNDAFKPAPIFNAATHNRGADSHGTNGGKKLRRKKQNKYLELKESNNDKFGSVDLGDLNFLVDSEEVENK